MNYEMVSGGVGNNLGGSFGRVLERADMKEPAARETEVPTELRQLQCALDECEKRLSMLTERLAPVLRYEPPSTESSGGQLVGGPQTQIGSRLNQMTGLARCINAQLCSLVERLEV